MKTNKIEDTNNETPNLNKLSCNEFNIVKINHGNVNDNKIDNNGCCIISSFSTKIDGKLLNKLKIHRGNSDINCKSNGNRNGNTNSKTKVIRKGKRKIKWTKEQEKYLCQLMG